MRAPHSTFWSFLHLHLDLFNLDVLRVLGEQTLDVSKEVKYPSILDPRLDKEVKYPSLTIIFNYKLISTREERGSVQFRRFFVGGCISRGR
jgi:hypothetical protein